MNKILSAEEEMFWRQDNPRWNRVEAWPKALFPYARFSLFRDSGCLVCSLALLLRRCGLETSETFSPWELNRSLQAIGAFSPEADLYISRIRGLYPLEYQDPVPYSREALERIAGNGFPCLLTVPGHNAERHFLCLLRLTPEDADIFDPAAGERKLSSYPKVLEIRWFRLPDGRTQP